MASKQAITLAFVCGGFLDGFKTGNHIGFCLWWFFGYFHLKKWGAQPQFCLTIRFLALKPCLAFMVKKTISSNAYYFLVLFLVVSHWFFGVTISHLSFFVGLWLLNFFRMLLTFFLEMFYKKHNIFFVGRGKKRFFGFFKKNSSIFKKREKTHYKLREKKPKGKFS